LLGRKAPFTHSLYSSVYNFFALLGRKAPFTHSHMTENYNYMEIRTNTICIHKYGVR